MMELLPEELTLLELFRQKAADKRLDQQIKLSERLFAEQKERHDRKLRKEEEERKLDEAVLATAEQIAAFQAHLDDYDTATVHALMDNQHAMDAVLRQREEMDTSAYRLPDGRMAFKTEDGRHVFDQRGAELPRETIHPDAIPGSAPSWEARQAIDLSEARLVRERDELHSFQQRLDQARETAGKDNVSADALARLDADLKRAMPQSVQDRMPGANSLPDAPDPLIGLVPATRRPGVAALAPGGP